MNPKSHLSDNKPPVKIMTPQELLYLSIKQKEQLAKYIDNTKLEKEGNGIKVFKR